VNGKVGDLENGLISSPVLADELAVLVNNNLTSKGKVSVEPGVPETTTIELNSKLLVTSSVVHLGDWGKLKDWRVSVATNNLVK
jgi:DNA-binding HxlR family transcriptional regulator